MLLQSPTLDYKASKKALHKYIDLYNADKKLGEKIRSTHIHLFEKLLSFYGTKLREARLMHSRSNPERCQVDTDQDQIIKTNNKALGKALKVNPATVWRYLTRMEKAGIIEKINHGKIKNYEIILKKELLALIAPENPGFDYIQAAPESLFLCNQIANCNAIKGSINRNPLKNKVITAESSLRSDNSSIEPSTETHKESASADNISIEPKKDTSMETLNGTNGNMQNLGDIIQKITGFSQKTHKKPEKKTKKIRSESNPWITSIKQTVHNEELKKSGKETYFERQKRVENEIKELKTQYAASIVQLFIVHLLHGLSVYEKEYESAVKYVEKNYFDGAITKTQLASLHHDYRKTIEFAARYKETHPGYKAPFPVWYFDLDNTTNSFKIAFQRYLKHKNTYEPKIKARKQRKLDQQRLQQAVVKVNKANTHDEFLRQLEYLRQTVFNPDIIRAFYAMTSDTLIQNTKSY